MSDIPMPSRCGAPTRQGSPCRRPASAHGRCRSHAGLPQSPDGQSLAETAPPPEAATDPAQRMRVLAELMAARAMAAHHGAADDPAGDSDAVDARIARAVRTAAQATRAELQAQKARGDDPPAPGEPAAEPIALYRLPDNGR